MNGGPGGQSEDPRDPVSRTNAVNPDLSGFRKAGGKLIQHHGWADEAMVPGYTAHYCMQVTDLQGGPNPVAKTQKFYRLFMVSGMDHCAGGSAPVNFGALSQPPATPVTTFSKRSTAGLNRARLPTG